jgi:hypothetical protein
MSYQEDPAKQLNINVSVGINNAAILAAATDDPFKNFFEHAADVIEFVLATQVEYAAQANLGAAPAPAAPAPAYQQPSNVVSMPQAAPAAPAPIPGAADGDPAVAALWADYFANPSGWWDNRGNKKNPKGPDFKRKDGGQGLWVSDKKNPSWVASRIPF